VRNEEVLLRVKEQRNILHEISKRKANWIGHIFRRNCLLRQVIEGKIMIIIIIHTYIQKLTVYIQPCNWVFKHLITRSQRNTDQTNINIRFSFHATEITVHGTRTSCFASLPLSFGWTAITNGSTDT
jgi:hypothetical protein